MMTIDFEELFASLPLHYEGKQKRVGIVSAVGVLYGVSHDGYLRLAFLSKTQPPKLESTRLLRIVDGEESPGVYWLCFDLLSNDVKAAFFAFCQNMTEAVQEAGSEAEALAKLRRRYLNWKTLFRNSPKPEIDKKKVQGLFGELYFLKNYMLTNYPANEAIMSWGGPDATSKDFAINTDWFEVKTIGVSSPCIEISSLAQLSSAYPGKLAIIRAESMPVEFSNGQSSISELISGILAEVIDEAVEATLLEKVASYGVWVSDEAFAIKFDVKSLRKYRVIPGFPRITVDDAPYSEIVDVKYSISVAAIEPFAEE